MYKNEFIDAVAKKSGLTKKDTRVLVDANLEVIIEVLAKGDSVAFEGFGAFKITNRAARNSRIPSTDVIVAVPARKAAKFKPGKALKNAVK
jgi:DNA-binding protein HU-beta